MMGFQVIETKHGPRLAFDGEQITYHRTRNRSKRRIKTPRAIIVHGTFGNPFNIEGSISWNQRVDIRGRGAAQIYIDRDGIVHGMNHLLDVVWHAGASKWKFIGDKRQKHHLNLHTIGIELACCGPLKRISDTIFKPKYVGMRIDLKKDGGTVSHGVYPKYPQHDLWYDYTEDQINSLVAVCRALTDKWDTIDEILTHYDIAPKRKKDCSPTLDMVRLRRAVFDDAPFFAKQGKKPAATRRDTSLPHVAESSDPGITIPEAKQVMLDLGFRITDVKSPVVGKTVRASLLELQDDNGLDLTGEFDADTLALLRSGRAVKKPDPELEKLDVATLRERGSSTIAEADNDERLAVGLPVVFTGVAGVEQVVHGQLFTGLSKMAGGITGLTKPFGFEVSPWTLLIACVVISASAFIMVRARIRKAKRVRDAKSGKKPR
jgi:N-acetyl-anhydromuramyl-L-alanine amidase AmpD